MYRMWIFYAFWNIAKRQKFQKKYSKRLLYMMWIDRFLMIWIRDTVLLKLSACTSIWNLYKFMLIICTKNLCKIIEENVQRSLEETHVEIRKNHLQLESIDESQDAAPIGLTVSYDGSWQRWGSRLKYSIGCCVEVTMGLLIDVEVISMYCC